MKNYFKKFWTNKVAALMAYRMAVKEGKQREAKGQEVDWGHLRKHFIESITMSMGAELLIFTISIVPAIILHTAIIRNHDWWGETIFIAVFLLFYFVANSFIQYLKEVMVGSANMINRDRMAQAAKKNFLKDIVGITPEEDQKYNLNTEMFEKLMKEQEGEDDDAEA